MSTKQILGYNEPLTLLIRYWRIYIGGYKEWRINKHLVLKIKRENLVVYGNLYFNAKSTTARKRPFKIISVQVNGGYEFIKDFEGYCKEMYIKFLYYHHESFNITVVRDGPSWLDSYAAKLG